MGKSLFANYRKTSIILASLLGILLIGILGLFLGRNPLLQHMANKRIGTAEDTYGLSIHYNSLRMKGVNEVELKGLSIVPHYRDTLLTLQTLNIELSFWKLLAGQIEIRQVRMNDLNASFIKTDSIANYDLLFRKKETAQEEQADRRDYAQKTDGMLNLIFGFLPENGELNQIHITERQDSNFVAIDIPALAIKDNHFQTGISIREDEQVQHWAVSGELNRETHTLKTKLHARDKEKVVLPYITRRFGAELTFDTLAYSLTKEREGSDRVMLNGEAEISGLHVYHKALSPEVINLDRGQLSYRINVGTNYLKVDSATNVKFNRMEFHPYLKAEKNDTLWHLTASVNKPWFPADDLFSSLPQGLFSNLKGIKTSGELAYHFLLDVDFALLDSLVLESELKEKDFRIVQYGATNLGKMSDQFIYTAYEDGEAVRTFSVGPSWEHFTPLDSISPLLQMSVIQSEDGAFYYHQGFLPKAMREALIHDLKVKRFARGGSTITMQLVKNVFLNRNKNIARKLEEALIVWLIETEKLTPKARMYEVYLNIAEWGPLVYGAYEASAYYFDKRPSQLTAEEAIFLASIIPKPKHFRGSFTEDMKLKESMAGYYRLIAERLVKKGLLSEHQADSIRPDIKIVGEAQKEFEIGEVPGAD
ncbi:transglycosylase domain-containing protein [Bacteroides sp.]